MQTMACEVCHGHGGWWFDRQGDRLPFHMMQDAGGWLVCAACGGEEADRPPQPTFVECDCWRENADGAYVCAHPGNCRGRPIAAQPLDCSPRRGEPIMPFSPARTEREDQLK